MQTAHLGSASHVSLRDDDRSMYQTYVYCINMGSAPTEPGNMVTHVHNRDGYSPSHPPTHPTPDDKMTMTKFGHSPILANFHHF